MLLGSLVGSLYKSQKEVGELLRSLWVIAGPCVKSKRRLVFGIVPEKGKPSILNHSRNSKEGFTEKAILFGELNSFVPSVVKQ